MRSLIGLGRIIGTPTLALTYSSQTMLQQVLERPWPSSHEDRWVRFMSPRVRIITLTDVSSRILLRAANVPAMLGRHCAPMLRGTSLLLALSGI
jgi:hypothetical protein